jgi:hypothetical protein
MDKLSIVIDPENWGNLITKYQPHSPKLKETDFSGGTINIDTDTNGSLSKRKGGPNYNATLLSAAPKDQFEAIFSDGARHLIVVANGTFKYSSGDTIFNSVTNGTGFNAGANFEFATTQDRVYGDNKINNPIVYDRISIYGGATPVVTPIIRQMGAPVPSTPLTAGAPTSGGAVPNGAHTYKVTFLYYGSEESNGSPVSGAQTATTGNNTIPLTAIPIGGYGVTARNIYRDNNDQNWVFVHQISDNTTTTYSDTVLSSATPTPIPTNNGSPPIFGLISLWLDRLWLAEVPGDPNTLFYSEAAQPDIYGSENQILCNQEDPITALVVYFDRLIVFNRHSMGQIVGSTPDTFRYAAIPSSVGCVDNRTLQTHVLHGVPVLIWLSERGFYTYDGNAIEYISDVIEDLVNFNISQAIQQKNSNTQTTFLSGTPSDGIDTLSIPGSITTKGFVDGTSLVGTNPRRNFNSQNDWEDALATKVNLVTKGTANEMSVPLRFAPTNAAGSFAGVSLGNFVESSHFYPGVILLPTISNLTGENNLSGLSNIPGSFPGSSSTTAYAQPITAPIYAGKLTSLSLKLKWAGINQNVKITVWGDSAGSPDNSSILYQGSNHFITTDGTITDSSINVTIAAGQKFWIGIVANSAHVANPIIDADAEVFGGGVVKVFTGSWFPFLSSVPHYGFVAYTFNQTPIALSGMWTSPVYDSGSLTMTPSGLSISQQNVSSNTTYTGSPCTTVTYVDGSNDADQLLPTWTLAATFDNLSSSTFTSPVAYRWWRIRIVLSTPDNRRHPFGTPAGTPAVTVGILDFNTTAAWESPVIDCTFDVTTYNSLIVQSATPTGTSVVTQIATSASSSGPWTYVAFGSHVVRQYVRIKVTLTANIPDTVSASVSSINFTWTLAANYISPIIDTGVNPPAGWDVFLAQFALNGGGIQFYMRSATTSGGIPAATFYPVTTAEFPLTVVPLQFVQWKVVITSSDTHVPQVDFVTVQWFIAIAASIRPASIFVDGRYYVALAELNQSVNNLVIELDLNAKWRRLAGLSVATFSFFFNRPYLGLSTSGQIRKFLEGYTDAGVPIEYDMRTKAFDFSTQYKDVSEKYKIVNEVIIHAKNTGAAIQVMYSVDEGANWYPFYTLDGLTNYQTSSGLDDFFLRLKPSWTNGNPIAGQHLMYRIYNNDIYNVEIHSLKATAMVRLHPPVITG